MTIDITGLIDTPPGDAFEARLKVFQRAYPHLFKETDMTDPDPFDEPVGHLNALLVDLDRDVLTLRADEDGGLRISWRSRRHGWVRTLDRIEPHPRLGLINTLRNMHETAGR